MEFKTHHNVAVDVPDDNDQVIDASTPLQSFPQRGIVGEAIGNGFSIVLKVVYLLNVGGFHSGWVSCGRVEVCVLEGGSCLNVCSCCLYVLVGNRRCLVEDV